MNIPDQKIRELKTFVDILKMHPDLLHDSRMSFFREYLVSLGAKIPDAPSTGPQATKSDEEMKEPESAAPEPEPEPEPEVESEPESDVELDMEGVIGKHSCDWNARVKFLKRLFPEPDNDPPQSMGDPSKVELSEEENDKFSDKRSEAMQAMSSGEWEKVCTKHLKLLNQLTNLNF